MTINILLLYERYVKNSYSAVFHITFFHFQRISCKKKSIIKIVNIYLGWGGDYERNMHVINGCYYGAIAPTKWALESIQPFTLLFIRLFFAGGICLLFSFKQLKRSVVHKQVPWKRMSLLSFTGVAGYFMFTSYGISLTSGLHVSIIDALYL